MILFMILFALACCFVPPLWYVFFVFCLLCLAMSAPAMFAWILAVGIGGAVVIKALQK